MRKLEQFRLESPIGPLEIYHENSIIRICEFADRKGRIERHLAHRYLAWDACASAPESYIANAFEAYFSGDITALEHLKHEAEGTNFEQRVWTELCRIPAGETRSYKKLAESMNSAPRAVGGANGRNPIALIVPCHRVIAEDGSLTGYAGGLNRKQWLLSHEARYAPPADELRLTG